MLRPGAGVEEGLKQDLSRDGVLAGLFLLAGQGPVEKPAVGGVGGEPFVVQVDGRPPGLANGLGHLPREPGLRALGVIHVEREADNNTIDLILIQHGEDGPGILRGAGPGVDDPQGRDNPRHRLAEGQSDAFCAQVHAEVSAAHGSP